MRSLPPLLRDNPSLAKPTVQAILGTLRGVISRQIELNSTAAAAAAAAHTDGDSNTRGRNSNKDVNSTHEDVSIKPGRHSESESDASHEQRSNRRHADESDGTNKDTNMRSHNEDGVYTSVHDHGMSAVCNQLAACAEICPDAAAYTLSTLISMVKETEDECVQTALLKCVMQVLFRACMCVHVYMCLHLKHRRTRSLR
jgi:hypothetical protein